jgi:maltokinase
VHPPLDTDARWFAGKARTVAGVAVAEELGELALADVAYADGGRERYLLLADERTPWSPLLAALADGPLAGSAGGRLELRPGPALGALAGAAGVGGDVVIPATDQTNTLAVLGGRLLVKAYRRLEAGVHPEVELLAALAATDAPVPGYAGSLHHIDADGTDTAIAVLQEFIPGAEDGWEAPLDRLAATLRGEDGGDPIGPYAAAGEVAARLHAALIATLGEQAGGAAQLAAWQAEAEATLDAAAAHDEELAALAPRVREELAAFAGVAPPPLARTHGDLHYAQLLRAPGHRVAVIDFEGDPTRPLAARRAPDTPLRDLACLLRSIDHMGSAAARRAGGADPSAWIETAMAAALAAYEEHAPVPVDRALLRALEVAKECGEYVYAQRVLPEWLYAPRLGMRRLLG